MTTERTPGDQKVTRSAALEHDSDSDSLDISDLAWRESIVAVAAAERDEEYYLLQVAEGAETLSRPEKDSWGCRYPAGAKVVRGLFFDKIEEDP